MAVEGMFASLLPCPPWLKKMHRMPVSTTCIMCNVMLSSLVLHQES